VNKAELINRVSESVEGGRTAASRAVEAVFDAIQEAVARGEKVAITGFGVFEKVDRAARTGRNPATNEPIEVQATSVPKFRPGSEFKAYVSGAKEFARGAVTSARAAAAQGARAVGDALAPDGAGSGGASGGAGAIDAGASSAGSGSAAAAPAKKAPAKKSATKAAKKAPAKKATADRTLRR
jgi:DNA-binding protein HU-beta